MTPTTETVTAPDAELPTGGVTEVETPVETTTATEQTPNKLFRFSTYLHVGEGAEECEGREDGSCEDPEHFHAWCRLPNQFQSQSIREKALAAKARRIRQLKNPESDGYAVLQGEMDMIRSAPGAHQQLVEDLVNRDFLKNHHEALSILKEDEKWEHVAEDQERLQYLDSLSEDERPADEFNELQGHLQEFQEGLIAEVKRLEAPLRESLESLGVDDLLDQLRDERVETEATTTFLNEYSRWEWLVCTLKPRPREKGAPKDRAWSDYTEMMQEAGEVLDALDEAFAELEEAKAAAGKS